MFDDYHQRQRRKRRRRKRRRRQRQQKQQKEKMQERMRKNPTWPMAVVTDPEKRSERIPHFRGSYGSWALKNSKQAALLVASRENLHDARIEGTTMLALACQHWEEAARTIWEEKPEVLTQNVYKTNATTLAHIIVGHWQSIAQEILDSPSKAMKTYGAEKPLIFSAITRNKKIGEQILDHYPELGMVTDDKGNTVYHALCRQRVEFALYLLQDEEVRQVEDDQGTSVLDVALQKHPIDILQHPDLPAQQPEGQDPLVHQIMERDNQKEYNWNVSADIRGVIRSNKKWLKVCDRENVPLIHRHIEVFGDQALDDPEIGRLQHPQKDGKTANMAALQAHPTPVNAIQAMRNAWKQRKPQTTRAQTT